MVNYDESGPIGSDTDEVLSDVLDLEASKYVEEPSSLLAEILSEDEKSLSSTLRAENVFGENRQEAEENRFGSERFEKILHKLV